MRFVVKENREIAPGVYLMRLSGDTRAITAPGQFVQVALPGFYLRRPISVCDWRPGDPGMLELIYKAVGHGTEAMGERKPGEELDLLTGLGNGFDVNRRDEVTASQFPLLVGGGVGAPPLYGLCKSLTAALKTPRVILGFGGAREVFLKEEFETLGAEVVLTTMDGSAGLRGLVTDGMERYRGKCDYVYACGPLPMLKAVWERCERDELPGQFSGEERMACGFGVCMGCSVQTKYGPKRVCKDGPVLVREEILW